MIGRVGALALRPAARAPCRSRLGTWSQHKQRRGLSLLGPTTKEEAVTWKIYGAYVAAAAGASSGVWQLYKWATQGVTHTVVLKLKTDTSPAQISAIEDGLRALPSKIPQIKSYSVGAQLAAVDDGRNATLGLVATFASEADYQVYAGHPEHKAVIVEKIVPCIAPGGRAALQFQA